MIMMSIKYCFKVLQYHRVFPKDHQTIGTVRRIGEIVARKQVLICFNIVLPGNHQILIGVIVAQMKVGRFDLFLPTLYSQAA